MYMYIYIYIYVLSVDGMVRYSFLLRPLPAWGSYFESNCQATFLRLALSGRPFETSQLFLASVFLLRPLAACSCSSRKKRDSNDHRP